MGAVFEGYTLSSFFATCRGILPWHFAVAPPAVKPSTAYHVTLPRTSKAYHRPLTLTLTLGAVALGCRGDCRGICHAVGLPCNAVAVAAGVVIVPPMEGHGTPPSPMACHGILRHAMGCRGDAMVCHGWYHGDATAHHEKLRLSRTLTAGPRVVTLTAPQTACVFLSVSTTTVRSGRCRQHSRQQQPP